MTFGALFGELIRSRRGVEGLTQQELSVRAFGDEGHKTRISELENGKIPSPQAKTIDALVVALNISSEELRALTENNQDSYFSDTVSDYFDFSEYSYVSISIDTTMSGGVALRHNCPFKIQIKRFEFFTEEKSLVIVTDTGSRRPVEVMLHDSVIDRIVTLDHIWVILLERGPLPSVLDHTQYPLKII